MKIIKTLAFASLFLLTLTAGKCFVVSSFDSSDDDDDNEGLTIVVTNAETASSEVVQSLNQTLGVAEIASQSAQYVNDIYISDSLNHTCDNPNGVISLTLNDKDGSNRISIGDDLFLSFFNCNQNDWIANGELNISVLDKKGIDIGRFDSGTDWLCTLSVNATSFQITTQSSALIVNGDLEITLQFDATSAMLRTKIKNNMLDLESESRRVLSAMEISQFINLAVVPSSYALSVDSLELSSDTLNGDVSITSKLEPLSGIENLKLSEYFVKLQAPETGALFVKGKNSNVEVSISSSELVTIKIDTNGDSIMELERYTTWPEIM